MNTYKDFYNLSQPDIYSILCQFLFELQGNAKYTTISELAYILDRESFVKLIKYFGGLTITIPTADELKSATKLMLLYQYKELENMKWHEALNKAGYEDTDSRSAQRNLAILKKTIENFKKGTRYYDA